MFATDWLNWSEPLVVVPIISRIAEKAVEEVGELLHSLSTTSITRSTWTRVERHLLILLG